MCGQGGPILTTGPVALAASGLVKLGFHIREVLRWLDPSWRLWGSIALVY
jgi:hypothetical protein